MHFVSQSSSFILLCVFFFCRRRRFFRWGNIFSQYFSLRVFCSLCVWCRWGTVKCLCRSVCGDGDNRWSVNNLQRNLEIKTKSLHKYKHFTQRWTIHAIFHHFCALFEATVLFYWQHSNVYTVHISNAATNRSFETRLFYGVERRFSI